MNEVREKFLPFRFGWNEWLGSVGDLGTLVPIFLSLSALNGLPLQKSLFLAGLVYLFTSLYFRVPIPVQPLKAMAAIVILKGASPGLLSAAGVWMGVILLAIALTKKTDWLEHCFPWLIVKGIQFGVGLILIKTSLSLILQSPAHYLAPKSAAQAFPSFRDCLTSLWLLVLPQLSLTLGNSIFATADVAREYFGEKSRRVRPESLAVSLGLANLTIGCLGGCPVCHGSGGLTAHVRFGARTGGATLILATLFILSSLLLPNRLFSLLSSIPAWLLGSMLLYVGICHAKFVLAVREKLWIALGMGLTALASNNLTYALIFGWMVLGGQKLLNHKFAIISV